MVDTSHRVPIQNFIFGSGHKNWGFYPQSTAGIVGFSPREKSIITQLSNQHHGKFSLCLTTSTSVQPGRIIFGVEENFSGSQVITTLLIIDSYYNVISDMITIGVKKIMNSWNESENTNQNDEGQVENKRGKMVVDSGSNVMYPKVEKWIRKQIRKKPIPSPIESLTLCYPIS